jgi:hypothetical protein
MDNLGYQNYAAVIAADPAPNRPTTLAHALHLSAEARTAQREWMEEAKARRGLLTDEEATRLAELETMFSELARYDLRMGPRRLVGRNTLHLADHNDNTGIRAVGLETYRVTAQNVVDGTAVPANTAWTSQMEAVGRFAAPAQGSALIVYENALMEEMDVEVKNGVSHTPLAVLNRWQDNPLYTLVLPNAWSTAGFFTARQNADIAGLMDLRDGLQSHTYDANLFSVLSPANPHGFGSKEMRCRLALNMIQVNAWYLLIDPACRAGMATHQTTKSDWPNAVTALSQDINNIAGICAIRALSICSGFVTEKTPVSAGNPSRPKVLTEAEQNACNEFWRIVEAYGVLLPKRANATFANGTVTFAVVADALAIVTDGNTVREPFTVAAGNEPFVEITPASDIAAVTTNVLTAARFLAVRGRALISIGTLAMDFADYTAVLAIIFRQSGHHFTSDNADAITKLLKRRYDALPGKPVGRRQGQEHLDTGCGLSLECLFTFGLHHIPPRALDEVLIGLSNASLISGVLIKRVFTSPAGGALPFLLEQVYQDVADAIPGLIATIAKGDATFKEAISAHNNALVAMRADPLSVDGWNTRWGFSQNAQLYGVQRANFDESRFRQLFGIFFDTMKYLSEVHHVDSATNLLKSPALRRIAETNGLNAKLMSVAVTQSISNPNGEWINAYAARLFASANE